MFLFAETFGKGVIYKVNDDILKKINLVALNKEILKKTKVEPLLPSFSNPIEGIERSMKLLNDMRQAEKAQKEAYDQELLSSIKNIEQNTASLKEIVNILQVNADNQDKIFEVLVDAISIGKAGSIEEANSIYSKVMTKIANITDDIETITKLNGIASSIYITFKAYLASKGIQI